MVMYRYIYTSKDLVEDDRYFDELSSLLDLLNYKSKINFDGEEQFSQCVGYFIQNYDPLEKVI